MKYQVTYNEQNGESLKDIKDFESIEDADNWVAEQNSMGIEVSDITNIYDSVTFSSNLDDDELKMLVKNLSRKVGKHTIAKTTDMLIILVSDDQGGGFKVEVKDKAISIHDYINDEFTPSYFTRGQVLMFMEMFKGKFKFAS